MAKCKDCGKRVIWATVDNKKVALDYEPERRYVLVKGSKNVAIERSAYKKHIETCEVAIKEKVRQETLSSDAKGVVTSMAENMNSMFNKLSKDLQVNDKALEDFLDDIPF